MSVVVPPSWAPKERGMSMRLGERLMRRLQAIMPGSMAATTAVFARNAESTLTVTMSRNMAWVRFRGLPNNLPRISSNAPVSSTAAAIGKRSAKAMMLLLLKVPYASDSERTPNATSTTSAPRRTISEGAPSMIRATEKANMPTTRKGCHFGGSTMKLHIVLGNPLSVYLSRHSWWPVSSQERGTPPRWFWHSVWQSAKEPTPGRATFTMNSFSSPSAIVQMMTKRATRTRPPTTRSERTALTC
mmetsp:Transcript_99628/g.282180  ORF Transcript_99628/g.282180 Transcript_99628/m.282180 type:complete len:244 (+) Transcript_99628:1602-2333(+)